MRSRNNNRRGEYSARKSFPPRGGIQKPYRNKRVATLRTKTRTRDEFEDQRRPSDRRTGEKRYTLMDRTATGKAVESRSEDIRTILAGLKTKDASEISLILGVDLEMANNYLKQATENENRLKRCLKYLDKAFQSETTTALKANLIKAMAETEFVRNTVDKLKQYFESKHSSEEDTSNLEAVCALLRIMIRVCLLNPSALTFIHGSFAVIRELVATIRYSMEYKKDPTSTNDTSERNTRIQATVRDSMEYKNDLTSANISSKGNTTTKPTEAENRMESDSDCLQNICSPKYREAEEDNIDHDSSNIYLRDNEKSRKQNLFTEGSDCLGEVNTCFANLEQLFAELDYTVKSCSSRRRKQMQHEPVNSEESSNENFRDIPIFPRLGDLNGDIKPNLRVHKAKWSYSSVDDYLDVQFRLLREDFVEPLREGIHAFTGQIKGKNKKTIQEISVYENIQILSAFCGDGVNHILSFDISKLRHVRWNMTKRLKYGSLVCLSANNFQTCYFAAIVDSEAKFRRQGRLHVKFAHVPNQIQQLVGSTFTMIESTAYFEAYRPVLSSLQSITENDLPFKEYIIRCKSDVSPPKYFLRKNSERTLDLRCLINPHFKIFSKCRRFTYPEEEIFEPNIDFSEDSKGLKKVNILDGKWPMEDQLHLNSSQLNALKTALTKEFSVIQGPPGCGKTYLGLKIAKVLLYNKRLWEHENGVRAQMLVVCYTNHALDQFMEGICSFYNGDIVRVGGRSRNETMAKFNYKSIKKERWNMEDMPSYKRGARFYAKRDVEDLKYKINIESEKIKVLREHIVHERSLSDEMGIDHYTQFKWLKKRPERLPPWLSFLGNSSIVEWLGIIDMAKRIQNEIYHDNPGKKDQNFESLLDKELNIENREAMTEISFDFKQQLKKKQEEELTAFKRENISLDFDEINDLKGHFFSDTKRKVVKRERRKLTKTLQHNLRRIKPMSKSEAMSVGDILTTRFTPEKRWALYLHWVQTKCNKIYQSYVKKLELYEKADALLKEVHMMEEKFIFQNADIIGMTITGAAKHKSVLREIKPTIMIVEEAAEVLESHLISNLTSGCEQLIMIGDHKQLKPKPNVYRLEREYNLDLSLFERMVRNGIRHDCLQIQHRMRPEIADNVRHFYGTLLDHESVKQFKSVNGIAHNLYFIDHSVKEKKDEELKSHTNVHEVQYLVALCKYLLLQGYNASDITILTTYKGQMYMMKKEMLEQGDVLNGVRMTIVDNYQGEENDIILLSLVRSNEEGRIGYLARDNRVCVALSRAKKGFYIIGNSTCMSSATDLWKQILNNMRQKGFVGKALPLCCQIHTEDAGIMAEYSEDFLGAPEGGCQKLCDIRLDCGHACGRFCHIINREHTDIICKKPCARKCRNGHQCKKVCWQECYCAETIIMTLPGCGHIIEIKCSVDLKDYSCKHICNKMLNCGHVCRRMCEDPCVCMEPISVNLPCDHDEILPCSVNPAKHKCIKDVQMLRTDCGHIETVKCRDVSKHTGCKIECNLRLDCGHLCKEICGVMVSDFDLMKDDRRAISKCPKGHFSYCKMSCKTNLKCGHTCKGSCCTCFKGRWHMLCKENCNCNLICGHNCKGKCGYCLPCTEECMRNCSHRICRKLCIEECIPCKSACIWKCEHFICTQPCGVYCNRARCNEPCNKLLPCKHRCIGMCGDPCPKLCRICDKKSVTDIHYGGENLPDSRFVQLQDCGHLVRYDIMDEYMDIDEGARLKRCPLCKEPIRTTNGNRYENIVNKIYIEINNFKRFVLRDYDFCCTLMTSASTQTKEMLDWIVATGCTACSNASTYYTLSNFYRRFQSPPGIFDFLACRNVVNILNRLAIFSFLNSIMKSCSTDKEVLFRGASLCLSSSQHSYEIEREVKRFLDRRQLEKIEEKYLVLGSSSKERREIIESANKVLLKPGQYSEEDRRNVQKYLHIFPKDIDTEVINLSIERVSIDRDAILRKGYIDITYPLQELYKQNGAKPNNSQGSSSNVSEQHLSKRQSETREQSDSSLYTNEPTHVTDSVENNQVSEVHTVDYKPFVSSTENKDSEETLLAPEIHISKGDEIACSTSTRVFEPLYRHIIVAGDEKNVNKDRNVLQIHYEEIEEGEIIENEISEMDLTKTGSNKNQDSKKSFQCITRRIRCNLQDIEDGEIEHASDAQEECLEFAEIEHNIDTDKESPKICAGASDDTSGQEETVLHTEHSFSEGIITKDMPCSSNKKDNPRENLLFGKETDFSMKLQSKTDTAKSRDGKGQTHVIKLFAWPSVPYFHSEQSVFHLKKIQEAGIQNSNGKDTGTRIQISALNNKKRSNNETNEKEPSKKKIKEEGKVLFTIHNFEVDIEDESKQDLNPVPKKTDKRNVIIKNNKFISNTNEAHEQYKKPGENKTFGNPFVIDKICWPKSPKATTSNIRQLVDYVDVDTYGDSHPDSESLYSQKSNLIERSTEAGTRKSQQIRQMQDKSKKAGTRSSNTPECSISSYNNRIISSMNNRETVSFYSDRTPKEHNRHSAQRKKTDLRNVIDKKKQSESKLRTYNATENNGRRGMHVQAREKAKEKLNHRNTTGKQSKAQQDHNVCNSSGMFGDSMQKSRCDLRDLLNSKSCP
ncbi:NFX1-type zinc finger-containing protein 1-like isoform X2 [Mercenaria mercenaria]|uniref:NFX1-type zinc finger-containing protein 1-like isoform X2 n=1 Tax=Mercenaria mercenaria TaxID=6596 RepID=UPI00234ED5A2|nr:NFX1-type zinc finger-containing protein 1-like isoform X2 [Mercenaria mercenaria]